MKYIILVPLLFFSCADKATRHLRKMERQMQKAIAAGANLDTLKTVIHDTVYFEHIRDEVKQDKEIDTVYVDTLCAELKSKPKERRQTRKKIQEIICPAIFIDSTYELHMKAQGLVYTLPIRVFIISNGGHFDYKIESGNLKVPIVKEENTITISSKRRPTYYDLIILALVTGLLGWAIGRLTGKKTTT